MKNPLENKYKCCEHLLSSLVLQFSGVKFCNEVANSIELMPYTGLEDLQKNEQRRQTIIENLKNGGDLNCSDCSLLCYKCWDTEYPSSSEIYKLTIFNWLHCNARCFYCSVSSNFDENVRKSEFYDALPVVEYLLEEGKLTENSYVNFQGGEPTMLEEFPVLLDLLLKKNCKLQVLTNAIKYEPLIAKMLREGNAENCMCVSLDCSSDSTFKKIKRVDRFKDVVSNITRYVEEAGDRSTNIRVKYIILPNFNDNKKEIDSFIDLCKEMKVKKVSITYDHRNLANKKGNKSSYDCKVLISYNYIENKCKQNNISIYREYWVDEHIKKLRQTIMKESLLLYLSKLLIFHVK